MATALSHAEPDLQIRHSIDRWFFTGMALAMTAIVLVSFVPSMVHPEGRHSPLSLLAGAHGLVFSAWLLLFLVQSALIATGNRRLHQRLGMVSLVILALMLPLAYATTVAMVRRGFDLSGDLHIDHDPAYGAVFAFSNLLIFAILTIAALAFRSRPEIHKRLMLFANIELMPAPLAHLIGHTPWLEALPAAIVMVPITLFILAAFARDLLASRRIHPITWCLAILRIVSGPIEAGPIGTSAAWHHFAYWLAR